MLIIGFLLLYLHVNNCDILRPKDNFTNINYEEDIGICLGASKTTQNMTDYEKFEAFKQNNCYPLVILEGLEATKLQLMINDCDLLTDDVLQNCNIMTDKNKHRFVWFQPPGLIKCESNVSEFLVWVSFVDDPVSALGNGKCLNAVFGQNLQTLSQFSNSTPPYILPDQPGMSITWYGNTPSTMNSSDCGIAAGEDIGQTTVPVGMFMGYQAMYDYTISMGYQPGLTLLPIPYDWRKMGGSNEVTTELQRSIVYAYEITGKKVIITAHSYGCLNFVVLMNSLPQSFKDQYIETFLGLACAWGGAAYVMDLTIAGLSLGWWDIGYPFSDLRNLIIGLTSIYDLIPKSIFNNSAQWGQQINSRAQIESNWNTSSQGQQITQFTWFPTPDKECFQDRTQDKQCGFHLYNFFKNPIVYDGNVTCMVNDTQIISLLEKYMVRTQEEIDFQKLVDEGKVSEQEQEETWGTQKLIPKNRIQLMMEMKSLNQIDQLINPGVQIHHIYGGHIQTDTWYNITGNPRNYTDNDQTAGKDAIEINTYWGDNTVNIDNAIVPSLKWAWEFDNNIENAKPVHMIDYCSNYSQLMSLDSTGKYTTTFQNITQNTYNGIMCTNKEHDEFPDDEYINKYASTLFKSGSPGTSLINLTESDINLIKQTCPHIMAPWPQQTTEELISYGINQQNLQNQKTIYDLSYSQPSDELIQYLQNFYSSLNNQQESQKESTIQQLINDLKSKFLKK